MPDNAIEIPDVLHLIQALQGFDPDDRIALSIDGPPSTSWYVAGAIGSSEHHFESMQLTENSLLCPEPSEKSVPGLVLWPDSVEKSSTVGTLLESLQSTDFTLNLFVIGCRPQNGRYAVMPTVSLTTGFSVPVDRVGNNQNLIWSKSALSLATLVARRHEDRVVTVNETHLIFGDWRRR